MIFKNPEYLYALFIIPVLIVIFIITKRKKSKSVCKFGDYDVIKKLMPLVSNRRTVIKFILQLIVLNLLIITIARPQFGSKLKEVKTEGIEIIIALDVSNSMLAKDIAPNRLEAAKRSISRMLDNLIDDKIGLIVFAGNAYMQVPITPDYTATKMLLSTITTNVIKEQGTAIGEAIKMSMNSFSPDKDYSKALIIITDGENHENDPLQIAKEAGEKGIKIYTIGLGSSKGTPIPIQGSSDYRKDREGRVIMTKLNETVLKNIANATGGKYIRANNTRLGINALYDEIEQLDKKEMETMEYSEYEDIFPYIVFVALFLLIIDFILLNRKNKKLEKFKIFNLQN